MPREITDADGTAWTAVQVFAGLGEDDPEETDAARVKGAPDRVHVVCTPSSGARSVRVQLPRRLGGVRDRRGDHRRDPRGGGRYPSSPMRMSPPSTRTGKDFTGTTHGAPAGDPSRTSNNP